MECRRLKSISFPGNQSFPLYWRVTKFTGSKAEKDRSAETSRVSLLFSFHLFLLLQVYSIHQIYSSIYSMSLPFLHFSSRLLFPFALSLLLSYAFHSHPIREENGSISCFLVSTCFSVYLMHFPTKHPCTDTWMNDCFFCCMQKPFSLFTSFLSHVSSASTHVSFTKLMSFFCNTFCNSLLLRSSFL